MIIAAIQAVLLLLLLTQHVVAVNSPRLFMSSSRYFYAICIIYVVDVFIMLFIVFYTL